MGGGMGPEMAVLVTSAKHRGSVCEADRRALAAYLHARPEVKTCKVYGLEDAWHCTQKTHREALKVAVTETTGDPQDFFTAG